MRSKFLVLTLAAAAFSGCSSSTDDFPRESVSGTVTLDGVPLAKGNIQFLPTAETQQAGSTGQISEGKFTIPRAAGPVPGAFKISITSDSGEQPAMVNGMPGGTGTPNRDLIPEQYNAQSTLTADVVAGGPNEFTFDLSTE